VEGDRRQRQDPGRGPAGLNEGPISEEPVAGGTGQTRGRRRSRQPARRAAPSLGVPVDRGAWP
jgi:hypothetical protein